MAELVDEVWLCACIMRNEPTAYRFVVTVFRSECDAHCESTAACNNHGPGTCDGSCTAGFGISTSDFTCGGKVGGCGSRLSVNVAVN